MEITAFLWVFTYSLGSLLNDLQDFDWQLKALLHSFIWPLYSYYVCLQGSLCSTSSGSLLVFGVFVEQLCWLEALSLGTLVFISPLSNPQGVFTVVVDNSVVPPVCDDG